MLIYRTPYGKVSAESTYTTFQKAVDRGYAVVIQDVRGRYASGGDFNPYFNEGKDGFDTIELLAKHDDCNGRVGMYGCSYMAWVQFEAATQAPMPTLGECLRDSRQQGSEPY